MVARCHNIVLPGSGGKSAIASIFVLVRPVPPTDNVRQAIAYVSYKANLRALVGDTVTTRMEKERRYTEKCFHEFFKGVGKFSEMPSQLRHAVFCDVLVDLEQLAGRCRRGGTDVGIWLVDGAFHGGPVGWRKLIKQTFQKWEKAGQLTEMMRLHRSFLEALADFAGLKV